MKPAQPGIFKPVETNAGNSVLMNVISSWIKRGLLEFWQSALPDDHVCVTLLKAGINTPEHTDWLEICANVNAQLKSASCTPLAKLVDHYQLDTCEIFIFCLLCELQTDHCINMTVHELQLPDKSSNLSVHLTTALVERLFPEQASYGFSYRLLHSPLVHDHLVTVSDEATLPLCKLQVSPFTAAIIAEQPASWPGCRFYRENEAGSLATSCKKDAEKMAFVLSQPGAQDTRVIIRGVPDSGRLAFAFIIARKLKLTPLCVPEKIWQAETALPYLCGFARWLPIIQTDIAPGTQLKLRHTPQMQTPVIIITGTDGGLDYSNLIEVETQQPALPEREKLWSELLENAKTANTLAPTAILSLNTIKKIAQHATQLAARSSDPLSIQHIQDARRYYGAEKLRTLSEPVFKSVERSAMAFTPAVQEGLDLLLLRAHRRESLWNNLGCTLQVTPSSGVRALFVGESGTGKTLAASYIATQLGAPLYRVDLSSVMNKYIGESEKNLSQLLDHAAAADVVLLFDEADSLFGSRSEGKETGERFANMLTNFLLSRIENHPGVVILTTNGKERIDKAFNRRIDVEVNFPLPGYAERLHLWQNHLGKQAISEEACATIASYCDFAGGQVRNAVLTAATYSDSSISINELLRGIYLEYGKLGRKVPKAIEQLQPVNNPVSTSKCRLSNVE